MQRKWLGVVAVALACLLTIPQAVEAGGAPGRVRLLVTEPQAAAERARMILGARSSIDVAYFIVGDEPFSLTALSLLRDAAKSGIRVRMIVDAQWNKMPTSVEAYLVRAGVEIRLYHPLRLNHLGWITRRMHDKLLIADRSAFIAGGRNVESPYFGLGRQLHRRDYLDLDIAVEGAAAEEAANYFDRLWTSDQVRPSRVRATPFEIAAGMWTLDGYGRWLTARIEIAKSNSEGLGPFQQVGSIRFLHDPVGRKGRAPGVAENLQQLIAEASRDVVIDSPYLVPTVGLWKALRDAHSRGVRVRILTNSLSTTDNLWPQAAYAAIKKRLVREGVELWEYAGPESLHAKAAVFDSRTAVVGSYNLDPRSQRLNTELAVVVEDSTFASGLHDDLEAQLKNAWRIDADGMPIGETTRYPGVSRGKVCELRLLRLIIPLVRGQI